MYSDSVQGHGSVLIEVLIETAFSVRTPAQPPATPTPIFSCFQICPTSGSIRTLSFRLFSLTFISFHAIAELPRPYPRLLAVDAEFLFLSIFSRSNHKKQRGTLVMPSLFNHEQAF